jgi:adenylate cyclase
VQEVSPKRRLSAILIADVVSYSRLVGSNEGDTLGRLKAFRREILDPKVFEFHGRVVKVSGDGILIEFPSTVEAVGCAPQVQRANAERNAQFPEDRRIVYRIGIHQGDIVVDGQDIFGDGVNVAARLEALCAPGGICVSGVVCDEMAGRIDVPFDGRGEHNLKNIARPLRIYGQRGDNRHACCTSHLGGRTAPFEDAASGCTCWPDCFGAADCGYRMAELAKICAKS